MRLSVKRAAVTQYASIVEISSHIERSNECMVVNNYDNDFFLIDWRYPNEEIGQIYHSDDFIYRNATGNPNVSSLYTTDVETRGPNVKLNQVIQNDDSVLTFIDETSANMQINSVIFGQVSPEVYANFINVVGNITGIPEEYASGNYEEIIPFISICNPVDKYDYEYFLETSAPRVILSGNDYAYLNQMVMNQIGFDFDNAEMYMDSFNLQNPVGPQYDMEVHFTENPNNSYPDTWNIQLNKFRDYQKIGISEGVIWNSYRPTMNYETSEYVLLPLNGETILSVSKINYVETGLSGNILDYEFVERIKGINLAGTSNNHKSNIYSIEINDSNLNLAIIDETTRELTHRIVERAIRDFASKVAPAHTILWKIIWKGQ